MPRICSSAATVARLALGQLDERRVGRAPIRPACPRAAAVRSRHAASSRATARARGSSWPTRGSRSHAVSGSRSSVADSSRRHSSLAHSSRPPRCRRRCDLVGQLEQMGDVLGGIAELLGGQRARVPARVARGLADPAAEDLRRAGCRIRPGRSRRRSRRRSGCRRCSSARFPRSGGGSRRPGVRRAGRSRSAGSASSSASGATSTSLERVDRARSGVSGDVGVVDGDLDQTQQRPVTALRHELGVDPEATRGPRRARHLGDVGRGRERPGLPRSHRGDPTAGRSVARERPGINGGIRHSSCGASLNRPRW